jgi:hypothetical protein
MQSENIAASIESCLSEDEAYSEWMRAEAAVSLADPRPNHSHAQVMAAAQALIEARRVVS